MENAETHFNIIRPIVLEFEEFIQDTWPDEITFDREKANETGVIVFCWKATNVPLPLKNMLVNEENLENGKVIRRELRQKIKDLLPSSLIKQSISEANSLLRDANRKHLPNVEKAVKKWLLETAETLKKVLGRDSAQDFLGKTPLPSHIKNGTIQALHYVVECKIDSLKNI